MSQRYVLLGDVVDSREISDREAFRRTLEDAQSDIRRSHESVLDAGPSTLKGIDELGAVLTSIEPIYDIVTALTDALHPRSIRLVVAHGEISVGTDEADVSTMDGTAFHRASELLANVESHGLRFDMDTGRGAIDTAIADEINLLVHMRESWTDRQREVIDRYTRAENQAALASELAVSQQAISNVLQRADWPFVETIQSRLRRTLQEVAE